MKQVLIVLLCAVLLSTGFVGQALAGAPSGNTIWYDEVYCTSLGQLGVYSESYILNRHYYGEYYYTTMIDNSNGSLLDWMIYEYSNNDFDLGHRRTWPDQTVSFTRIAKSISQSVWHTLKTEWNGSGWTLYYDGSSQGSVTWQNSSNKKSCTGVEVVRNGSPNSFMGRHKNIQIKASNGNWYLFDSGWTWLVDYGARDGQGDNPWGYPIFNANHYDWEART